MMYQFYWNHVTLQHFYVAMIRNQSREILYKKMNYTDSAKLCPSVCLSQKIQVSNHMTCGVKDKSEIENVNCLKLWCCVPFSADNGTEDVNEDGAEEDQNEDGDVEMAEEVREEEEEENDEPSEESNEVAAEASEDANKDENAEGAEETEEAKEGEGDEGEEKKEGEEDEDKDKSDGMYQYYVCQV